MRVLTICFKSIIELYKNKDNVNNKDSKNNEDNDNNNNKDNKVNNNKDNTNSELQNY